MRWPTGLLVILLALTGCERRSAPIPQDTSATPGSPAKGDWVVQQIPADPDSLNPVVSADSTGQMIAGQVFDGMLVMNNQTLRLDPCLASTWEISADQLIYTFHLRHDVTWQDGLPFTATDVKYTFDRILDPKVDDAPVRSYFTTLKSCEVIDPYTVRFVTTERYFKMLEMLGTTPVVPEHLLKNAADFNNAPFNRAPVGTGPYKFVRWDTGSQVVLERNDHYWGTQNHYLDRIIYRIIQEPYVAAALLKKGEIDVIESVQPLQWTRELEHSNSMGRLTRAVYDYPAYTYFAFNLRDPKFQDVRVRHAIDLLIPRDKILSQLYFNQYAKPTEGWEPPGSASYNHDIPITPYDPTQAATLLQQAGYRLNPSDGLLHRGGQALSFTVVYPAGGSNGEKMLELTQESFRQAGIELKLQRLEWVQLLAKLDDWEFETTLNSWALDVNSDPSQLWSSDQAKLKKSSNFGGYANPVADQLMAAGRLEYDDAKRAAIYRKLQQVIHDDYPVCFLFNPRLIMLRSNRFENVSFFTPRPCFDVTTWWVPHQVQRYGPVTAQIP